MLWYRDLGLTELIFMASFGVLYALYLVRIIRIARVLKTPYGKVFIKLGFRTLYFALFIIAVMGPSFGGSKK